MEPEFRKECGSNRKRREKAVSEGTLEQAAFADHLLRSGIFPRTGLGYRKGRDYKNGGPKKFDTKKKLLIFD